MSELTNELKTIEDLAPASYNPRSIKTKAGEGLGASLSKFGDISGITFNARTGRLVCGHQRLAQLKALGAQLFYENGAPVIRVGQDGKRFPVRIVDWDEATEKAANVTANNRHIAGEFTDNLNDLLSEICGSIGDQEASALNLDELLLEVKPKYMEAEHGDTDPYAEWVGMPEYESLDPCFRKVIVNFDSAEDVHEFFTLVGQDYTEKTKSIWFPHKERRDNESMRWGGDSE